MKDLDNSIKSWSNNDKPREKLMLQGRASVSDTELIAILIGTGTTKKSAVDLAREILALTNGNLYELGKLRLQDFCKINGIGNSKAVSILAALELGRRRSETSSSKSQIITSTNDAYQLLKPLMQDLFNEVFYCVYLNRRNNVLKISKLFSGTRTSCLTDISMILKEAIDLQATAFIVAHNHPSGNLKASESDIKFTNQLIQASNLFDIQVLDHLILTDNGFLSIMKDNLD